MTQQIAIPELKHCRYCHTDKQLSAFSKDKSRKDGLASRCKDCQAIYKKEYYAKNKEQLKKYSREYHNKYNTTEEHKERRRLYHKTHQRDLVKRRADHKDRYSKDTNYSLNHKARSMLKRCLKLSGTEKKHPTFKAIGYTSEQLKHRMECQFKAGMSWDNAGEWEIDHKIPLAVFIGRGETRPHILNALSNLQPLWKFDNRSKGARYVG